LCFEHEPLLPENGVRQILNLVHLSFRHEPQFLKIDQFDQKKSPLSFSKSFEKRDWQGPQHGGQSVTSHGGPVDPKRRSSPSAGENAARTPFGQVWPSLEPMNA